MNHPRSISSIRYALQCAVYYSFVSFGVLVLPSVFGEMGALGLRAISLNILLCIFLSFILGALYLLPAWILSILIRRQSHPVWYWLEPILLWFWPLSAILWIFGRN